MSAWEVCAAADCKVLGLPLEPDNFPGMTILSGFFMRGGLGRVLSEVKAGDCEGVESVGHTIPPLKRLLIFLLLLPSAASPCSSALPVSFMGPEAEARTEVETGEDVFEPVEIVWERTAGADGLEDKEFEEFLLILILRDSTISLRCVGFSGGLGLAAGVERDGEVTRLSETLAMEAGE